jgi:hypothetical protein
MVVWLAQANQLYFDIYNSLDVGGLGTESAPFGGRDNFRLQDVPSLSSHSPFGSFSQRQEILPGHRMNPSIGYTPFNLHPQLALPSPFTDQHPPTLVRLGLVGFLFTTDMMCTQTSCIGYTVSPFSIFATTVHSNSNAMRTATITHHSSTFGQCLFTTIIQTQYIVITL